MDHKISIVKEWLTFALRDLNSAKYLLGMRPIPLEIICYHCEQAAEKALKGYLVFCDAEPPRIHVLQILCKMCADFDETFNEISKSSGNLTLYGVHPRYPFEIEITEDDMKKAIFDAESIVRFVLNKVQLDDKLY